MAVGLADDVADTCAKHLAPLPLLRVAHVAAAVERMVVLRPRIVVVNSSGVNLETLLERAEDVGAEVCELTSEMNERMVVALVNGAKARADKRR